MKKIILALAIVSTLCSCGQSTWKPGGDKQVEDSSTSTPTTIIEKIDPSTYQTQNPENMQKVCDFIKGCGYYFLATVDGDKARVRPFGTCTLFEGKLYIQTGHKKRTAQQLAQNPNAEICAYNTQDGKWLRLSGKLIEDERVEAKKALLDANPQLRSMYNENDDNTAVYFFKDAVAYISSFAGADEEIRF